MSKPSGYSVQNIIYSIYILLVVALVFAIWSFFQIYNLNKRINVGTTSIGVGSNTVTINDNKIKSGSVILVQQTGAVNATATTFTVQTITPGTSFVINSNANATVAAVNLSYYIFY